MKLLCVYFIVLLYFQLPVVQQSVAQDESPSSSSSSLYTTTPAITTTTTGEASSSSSTSTSVNNETTTGLYTTTTAITTTTTGGTSSSSSTSTSVNTQTTTGTTTGTTTSITTTPPTTTTTVSPRQESDVTQHSFTWSSSDSSITDVTITVAKGYAIGVTVSDVDIQYGNYLYLKSTGSPLPFASDGTVFTGKIKDVKKYLFRTTSILAHFEYASTTAVVGDDKFKLVFERIGEPPTTTTTISTTTVYLPPTQPSDSLYYTVNVTTSSEYNVPEIQNRFKSCVVDMAKTFTDVEGVNVTEIINEKYVGIDAIERCPYSWPDSDKCIQIRFKLPIFHDEEKWRGYQMDSDHLSIMWKRYASRCKDFSAYHNPDVGGIVMWWAIGISVVLAVFVLLLWFLKVTSNKWNAIIARRRRPHSDTRSIISSARTSNRDSINSMEPHYLVIPKAFEN